MTRAASHAARDLLAGRSHGTLATHSVRYTGYPLGSLTPYVLDASGEPVILIASIAQHTVNLQRDPRCSLTVIEAGEGEVQAHGRLSVLADAVPLAEPEALETGERYQRFFPEAADYHATHDFSYWRLRPVALRYIGGFGKIHWLEPGETLTGNPFAGRAEASACAHMNAEHTEALRKYCALANLDTSTLAPQMVGVDAGALYLRLGQRIHRLAFRRHLTDLEQLRAETIAMCQAEYWQQTRAA